MFYSGYYSCSAVLQDKAKNTTTESKTENTTTESTTTKITIRKRVRTHQTKI